jgi:hypothetical protein
MGDEAGLLKINEMGYMVWYKEYDFGDDDNYDNRLEAVCRTNDGGFILTGWGSNKSLDYWMIKTDFSGNIIWDKTFGGAGDDYGHCKNCYQTNDGCYIMGGFSSSVGAGGFDLWIIKTDSEGDLLWNKTYGGKNNDVCWGITSTDNGGYVAVVTINYGGFSGDKDDIKIVNIDKNGNIVWVQEYGGPDIQIGGSIDNTYDGGFIVSGCTGKFHSSKSDGLLVKFAPFENQRPDKPQRPAGPKNGKPDIEYVFTTSSSDPDGDSLKFLWDWGDGNYSEILDSSQATYNWSYEDNFHVRVKAIDEHGGESDWSDPLVFSTPRTRVINQYRILILEFIQKFSILRYPLLCDNNFHPHLCSITPQILQASLI